MPLAASSDKSGPYQLHLQKQKANVFVTQLTEQDGYEGDDVKRYPVVEEPSDELLKTGIHTLQKTSLLRKAVEVKQVDEELAEKRVEFRERMLVNKSKMDALMKRQEKIKDRVTKFDKFLKENEAKRSRALHKYQVEVKSNKLKSKELVHIKGTIDRLNAAKAALQKKLDQHQKFEEFMSRFVDALPDGFLPFSGDNLIENCIQRHEGLSTTKMNIIEKNRERAIEIEEGQRQLEVMQQERYKLQLIFSQEMTELLQKKDHLIEKNNRLEQSIAENQKNRRFMASQLGRILLAIDNLAIISHSRHWPPLTDMSYEAKLVMIKRKFLDQLRVFNLVQRTKELKSRKESDVDLNTTRFPSLVSTANLANHVHSISTLK